MIDDELRTYILADPIVGATLVDRLFSISLPQEVDLPAATFLLVSNNREETHDGIVHSARSRIRFHVYAETYTEIKNLCRAIRRRMRTLNVGVTDVQSTNYLGMNDGELETDLDLKHRILEFMVFYDDNDV